MKLHPRHLLSVAATLLAVLALGACSKPREVAAAIPAVAAPASAAQVSDADVTEHVKTALVQAAVLKGLDITVVTLNGDVRLTGMVDTQAQIDEALHIARTAEGTHTIHDELAIRK